MIRYLLAGAAVLALAAGPALAQDQSNETTTRTTVTTVPPVSGHVEKKTEEKVEGNGVDIEKKQEYQSDSSGSRTASESHEKTPYGEKNSEYHEENKASPLGSETTTSKTTTTTEDR